MACKIHSLLCCGDKALHELAQKQKTKAENEYKIKYFSVNKPASTYHCQCTELKVFLLSFLMCS